MPSYPMKKIYGWKGVLEVKEEATGKQTPSLGRRLMQRYLIDGLSGMAMGLFCTLIVGLILKQIGGLIGDNWVGRVFTHVGSIANYATGFGIGIGTAANLKMPKLVMYSSGVVGFIGAYASQLAAGTLLSDSTMLLSGPGDPLGAFVAALVGMEIGRLVSGRTKLDIIITPIVTLSCGGLVGILVGPGLSDAMNAFGALVKEWTELQPFWMGIIVSVVMGMVLTLPISSAALSIIIGLSGLAGGAATVGCCCQMIGFAVASFKENGFNGLLAQGLGTSMLQVPNIVRNPRIWIPPTLASAILGPVSTMWFQMTDNPSGSGMGTSGLVGQFMTWQDMSAAEDPWILLLKILILHFVLPAILTLGISTFMRRKGWIKDGDMKLEA